MDKAREIAQTEVGVEAGLILKLMEERRSSRGLSFEKLVEAIKETDQELMTEDIEEI